MRASIPTRRRTALSRSRERTERSLASHQHPSGLDLVLVVDLVEDLAGDLVVDPLAAQLLGQRAAGQPATGLALRHPLAGEGGVVDQADLLEPVEQPGGDVVRHVAAGQLVGQLRAGAGPPGQLVEQDLAGHRLRVGVGAGVETLARLSCLRSRPPLRGPCSAVTPVDRVTAIRSRCRRGQYPARRREARSPARQAASTAGPMPSFSRIRFSSSLARSGLSRRKVRAFSLPWPSWSPS